MAFYSIKLLSPRIKYASATALQCISEVRGKAELIISDSFVMEMLSLRVDRIWAIIWKIIIDFTQKRSYISCESFQTIAWGLTSATCRYDPTVFGSKSKYKGQSFRITMFKTRLVNGTHSSGLAEFRLNALGNQTEIFHRIFCHRSCVRLNSAVLVLFPRKI